jgi:hypothetical protein
MYGASYQLIHKYGAAGRRDYISQEGNSEGTCNDGAISCSHNRGMVIAAFVMSILGVSFGITAFVLSVVNAVRISRQNKNSTLNKERHRSYKPRSKCNGQCSECCATINAIRSVVDGYDDYSEVGK